MHCGDNNTCSLLILLSSLSGCFLCSGKILLARLLLQLLLAVATSKSADVRNSPSHRQDVSLKGSGQLNAHGRQILCAHNPKHHVLFVPYRIPFVTMQPSTANVQGSPTLLDRGTSFNGQYVAGPHTQSTLLVSCCEANHALS